MFDHVTIRVSNLSESARFYRRVFELLDFQGEPTEDEVFLEWNDFSISQARSGKPLTQNLHAGFAAESHEQIDAWWRALTEAGYRNDGEPGPRPEYGPDYYGAFVLDPDGNSIEAMKNLPRPDGAGVIDHLWIRVRDLAASARFYETVAPVVGWEVRPQRDRVQFRGPAATFSILEWEPTEHVHIAFPAPDRETVDAFHEAARGAGYRDNGAPGERPEYHPGYYGAFVLDPDGHNIEAVFHDR